MLGLGICKIFVLSNAHGESTSTHTHIPYCQRTKQVIVLFNFVEMYTVQQKSLGRAELL